MDSAETRHGGLTARWLIRLRALPMVVLAVLALRNTDQPAVLWTCLVAAVLIMATNLGLHAWLRRSGEVPAGAVVAALAVDVAWLTALLGLTGGDANPFAATYTVVVVLAALSVPAWGAATLLGLSVVAYASLFYWAPAELHGHDHAAMRGHVWGMFLAYVATAGGLTVAVERIRRRSEETSRRLAAVRAREARQERVAALATLAAGASHELSTPLSTILVVTRELELRLESDVDLEDLALIREELLRCGEVLGQLSAGAGEGRGESPRDVALSALVDGALQGVARAPTVESIAPDVRIRVPVDLVSQALRRLVDNAWQAGASTVRLGAECVDDAVRFAVRDDGRGMSAEVRSQVGEPFFTTRQAEGGRGLGLFFVRSLAHQLGGHLDIESTPGAGSSVSLVLPSEVGAP